MKKLIIFLIFTSVSVFSQELIIGEERVSPGINIIFEGAIRDKIIQTYTLKLELIGIMKISRKELQVAALLPI
jgi:hypothetical protein